MQTVKKSTIIPLVSSPDKQSGEEAKSHYAIVTDDSGIHSAFELVKIKLKDEYKCFLSLIYAVSDPLSPPLFAAELDSLERRYFSQLITYYEYSGVGTSNEMPPINLQLLEIIINSNTCEKFRFLLFGRDEFTTLVTDRLLFLGINLNQIHSQIFK